MRDLLLIAALSGLVACSESTTGGAGGGTTGTLVPCADCVADSVSWGPDGGLALFRDASSLTSCRTYAHTRTPEYGQPMGAMPSSCTGEIGGCDAGPVAVHDLEQALASPDVIAALAGSTPVYGTDPRPCDGAVQRITVGSRSILVGDECSTGDSCLPNVPCVPVPAGVRALVNVLASLDQEALSVGECKQTFPNGLD